jgi:hypothetical protein
MFAPGRLERSGGSRLSSRIRGTSDAGLLARGIRLVSRPETRQYETQTGGYLGNVGKEAYGRGGWNRDGAAFRLTL